MKISNTESKPILMEGGAKGARDIAHVQAGKNVQEG